MIDSKELIEYSKKLTILFVEDDKELSLNTSEILKNFFLDVDVAFDGEEALERYKSNVYDIVITDIRMPKLNGVALTEKIYEIDPDQSVIVLSAHDNSSYLLPLINLGIEQFITKPIDYQELLRTLLKVSKNLVHKKESLNQLSDEMILLGDGIKYDRETRILKGKEGNIYLTKYEIVLIQLMSSKIGKIYSNDDIVAHFESQNETIDAQNIRKLVSKIRKKLPKNVLESIYAIGYRLVIPE
jgi:DNA-binding response OmpR family regulator